MARKMYRRLTQPVFDGRGDVVHQPGDLIAADAPMDPAVRYEDVEVDEPDPVPAADAPAAPRHATVKAEPAQGKGAAHK